MVIIGYLARASTCFIRVPERCSTLWSTLLVQRLGECIAIGDNLEWDAKEINSQLGYSFDDS